MSRNDIKMNIRFSESFDTYVFKNPSVVSRLPKGASIVFASARHPRLTEKNLEIVQKSKERGPWYQARRERGKWVLRKLNPGKIAA